MLLGVVALRQQDHFYLTFITILLFLMHVFPFLQSLVSRLKGEHYFPDIRALFYIQCGVGGIFWLALG